MEAFDLYSPEIDANPFPYYETLREQYPCYWSESGKLWILSRYDDIVQAARDWETFSSAQGIALKRFLQRVPDYCLTTQKLEWNTSSNFRSRVALPFALQ